MIIDSIRGLGKIPEDFSHVLPIGALQISDQQPLRHQFHLLHFLDDIQIRAKIAVSPLVFVVAGAPEGGLQETDVAVIADIVLSQSDYTLSDIRVVEVQ